MKNKKDISYWNIIKHAMKTFFETEQSAAGMINAIFGFFVFVLEFLLCIPRIVDVILAWLKPGSNILMPWYAQLAFFICGIVYFIYCANSLAKIQKLQKQINQ